jgi:hypothetical protein
MKNLLVSLVTLCALGFLVPACDMTMIFPDRPPETGAAGDGGISDDERAVIEAEGRWLKLVNMPYNTQAQDLTLASVSNGAAAIARLDTGEKVKVYRDKETLKSIMYIPLIYTNGARFTEDGRFYVVFAVYADALTWVNVKAGDKVLVDFLDGRGTLDVLSLPEETVSFPDTSADTSGGPNAPGGSGGSSGGSEDQINEQIEELIRNGRYLQLYHLPMGTTAADISGVRVSDGSRSLATPDAALSILLQNTPPFVNAYIPLASSGGVFTRSGNFFVEFTVILDALTRIVVRPSHQVIVEFTEGQGTLDVEKLSKQPFPPGEGIIEEDDNGNPGEGGGADLDPGAGGGEGADLEAIIASGGGYLRFFNLPRNVSPAKFSAVSVSSSSGVIARCADYEAIAVRRGAVSAEAFVPLTASRNSAPFTETGSYFIAFTVTVDALSSLSSTGLLRPFGEGVAEIDAANIPPPPAVQPVSRGSLTVTGLPLTASPANFLDVFVHNSEGVVAKCPDYSKISIMPFNGQRAAVIPLVYDNNRTFNGQDFSDSGGFIVTFGFFPDALSASIVTLENNCLVTFQNGGAVLDLAAVPAVPQTWLTVSGLPAHTQELNVSSVFVWNQAGKIGQCRDYQSVIILQQGAASTVKIPLGYSAGNRIFAETGTFYVSFDLNVDALIRITLTAEDRVAVHFSNGNGSLDAASLPHALPTPYLTIAGLPVNAAKGNFSEVFLYNAAGKIAKCADYNEIIISKNSTSATALIPLVYNNNPQEYFRDSGTFLVTFTATVDVNIQIIKTAGDSLAVTFTDGSGLYNLASGYGYLSGGLKNPSDLSPPVIARGTVFEMNAGYFQVGADTAVTAASFPGTCLVYVYAVPKTIGFAFEYSRDPPSWNAQKNGYYRGNSRALWKFIYVKDTVDGCFAKTPVSAPFPAYAYHTLTNAAIGASTTAQVFSLAGSANPAPQTLALQPGAYVFVLSGAGGGGGGGIDGIDSRNRTGGAGGRGGAVSELVVFTTVQNLTVYTGSGGGGSGHIPYGVYQGAGGGGGGAGTFVYSPGGYILCAGGGGGGSGGNAGDGGSGGGGAGGSIGAGGSGGGGGTDYEDFFLTREAFPGSGGGAGGGYGGGNSVATDQPGAAASYALSPTDWGFHGSGGPADQGGLRGGAGGPAAWNNYSAPDTWRNTNNANGQGANDPGLPWEGTNGLAGGSGGNNRNGLRGDGAQGGAGGVPSDSSASAGAPGAHGSLSVYRVFLQ